MHAIGGRLVDGNHHRLALKAAPEKVLDEILGDRFQALVAGDQVILPSQFPLQLPFAFFGKLGVFD